MGKTTQQEEQHQLPPQQAAAEENEQSPNDDGEQQQQQQAKQPTRHLIHKLFILVSVVTSLVALWMAAGQILGIVYYENTPVQATLRGYVILLCLLAVFIELEWPTAAAFSAGVLHNWLFRGVFYVFIGVIGMQENETSTVLKNKEYENYDAIQDILKAVAWNMIGCGALYFVMGIFCLQYVLGRMRKNYQDRLERFKKDKQRKKKKNSEEGGATSDDDIEAAQSDADEEDSGLNAKNSVSMDEYVESHQEGAEENVLGSDADEIQESASENDDVEAKKEQRAESSSSVGSDGSSIEDKDEEISAASSAKAEKV